MSVNRSTELVMPLTAPGTWDAVINPKAVINNVPPLPFYGPMPMPGVGFAAPIPLNNYTSFLSANPKGGMSMNVPLISNASQAPAVAAMPMMGMMGGPVVAPMMQGGADDKKGGFFAAASVGPALSGFPVAPAFPLGRTGALPAATFGTAPIFGGPVMTPMGPNQSVVTIDNKPITTINNTPGAISGALGLGFPGVVGMGGLPKLQMSHPKLPLLPNAVGSVIPPMAAGPAINITPQFTHSAVTVAAPGRTVTTIAPNTNNFGNVLSSLIKPLWNSFIHNSNSNNQYAGSGIMIIRDDEIDLYKKEKTYNGVKEDYFEDAGGPIPQDILATNDSIEIKLAKNAIRQLAKDISKQEIDITNAGITVEFLNKKFSCPDPTDKGKKYELYRHIDIIFENDQLFNNNQLYRLFLIHANEINHTMIQPKPDMYAQIKLAEIIMCATISGNSSTFTKCPTTNKGNINISNRVYNGMLTALQKVEGNVSFYHMFINCPK